MNWTDRITILVGAAAVVATLGVGTCSTNGRFDDVHRRIDDMNERFDNRFDGVNVRIDELHTDVREIRGLLIELLQNDRADQ
ncbi:MAG: hypothetical protein OXQ29_05275 [Rhodospirillaceae bacterium]|nr:hypothetical protein [Rhodospirillaceae bacterium]